VPLKVYDETIRVLKSAVASARLGREEELAAIRRLDAQARQLERRASGPTVPEYIAEERAKSPLYGDRTIMDDRAERGAWLQTARQPAKQADLFSPSAAPTPERSRLFVR
jgi:hypothetical protein